MKDIDSKSESSDISRDSGLDSLGEVEDANEFTQRGGKLSFFVLGNFSCIDSSILMIKFNI